MRLVIARCCIAVGMRQCICLAPLPFQCCKYCTIIPGAVLAFGDWGVTKQCCEDNEQFLFVCIPQLWHSGGTFVSPLVTLRGTLVTNGISFRCLSPISTVLYAAIRWLLLLVSGGAVWRTLTRWRQVWCVCSGVKTVWSIPERFRCEFLTLGRYTNLCTFPVPHRL